MTDDTTASKTARERSFLPGWLHRIVRDEEASAAVEFIMLIPIYVLLMTALWMIANLAIARQALVVAVRYQAWEVKAAPGSAADGSGGGQTTDYDKVFFAPDGTYSNPTALSQTPTGPVIKLSGSGVLSAADESDTKKALKFQGSGFLAGLAAFAGFGARENEKDRIGDDQDFSSSETNAIAAATQVLRNDYTFDGTQGDLPFRLSTVTGKFTYSGITLLGLTNLSQETRGAVLLPQKHTRPIYKEDTGEHPVLVWGNLSNSHSPLDPSQDAYIPLSPLYTGYIEPMFQPAANQPRDGNVGLWNNSNYWGRIKESGATGYPSFDTEKEYYDKAVQAMWGGS